MTKFRNDQAVNNLPVHGTLFDFPAYLLQDPLVHIPGLKGVGERNQRLFKADPFIMETLEGDQRAGAGDEFQLIDRLGNKVICTGFNSLKPLP